MSETIDESAAPINFEFHDAHTAMSRHRKRLRVPKRYTLTELEDHDWGPPTYHSWLVQSVHRLRHVPLTDLTADNLRLLIGQSVSLNYVVPVALDMLERDPFIDAGLYPGDLLAAVVGIKSDFWRTNTELADRAVSVACLGLDRIDTADVCADMLPTIQSFLEARSVQ